MVSVHSAPTMTLEGRRHNSPPKWVNPCGLAAEDFTGDLDVVQLTDSQLLQQVVLQAKTALMHAELFRDDYVSTDCTFIFLFSLSFSARARAYILVVVPLGETFSKCLEYFSGYLRCDPTRARYRRSETKIKFINGSIITDVTSGEDRTGKGDIERKAVMAVLPVVRTLIVESHRPSKEISDLRIVFCSRSRICFRI